MASCVGHLLLLLATWASVSEGLHLSAPSGVTGQSNYSTIIALLENNAVRSGQYLKKSGEGLHRQPTLPYSMNETHSSHWGTDNGVKDWTAGFFPGLIWMMYHVNTDNAILLSHAESFTFLLDPRVLDDSTDDVGMVIFASYVKGSIFHPKEGIRDNYKRVSLIAAQSLAKRFHKTSGVIKSWERSQSCPGVAEEAVPVTIDGMMNLELLFWAARRTGDMKGVSHRYRHHLLPVFLSGDELFEMAVSHVDQTSENHVREDGSTIQIVAYQGKTVANRCHRNGIDDNSTWSRGQAFAVYGFTMAYRFTGFDRHLQAAIRTADFFMRATEEMPHNPRDGIPLWDFAYRGSDGGDIHHRDSSAAAIVASALLELADHVDEVDRDGSKYRAFAHKLLRSLEAGYLGDPEKTEGTLLHVTGRYGTDEYVPLEVDTSIIYADYYLAEAVLRATGQLPTTMT